MRSRRISSLTRLDISPCVSAETQTAQQAIQNTKPTIEEATHGKTTPLPDPSVETRASVEKKNIPLDVPALGPGQHNATKCYL